MTSHRIASLALAMGLFTVAGCGDETPADVSGRYTISLTNGANGCAIPGWEEDRMTQGVGLVVNQDPASPSRVMATVEPPASLLLQALLLSSSATFEGTLSGNRLNLAITSENPGIPRGNCDVRGRARLNAIASGDVLTGTVTYGYLTDMASDCGTLSTCESVQAFNGTRPPRP